MKPVSLRFKCFGPYMEEQYVNFEELSSKGIFLISGETGSGKTTILDAICYALFGKSSGGLRGDIEVMRCKSATPSDETAVEYIFESNGKTYKFHRELSYGRKNMNEHDGCEVLVNNVYEPIFENPQKTAVNKKAEEIIGLTYDQFCQVVILPQGKFEKLLVSNSEDKEEILTSLFHADRWNSIVKKIKDKVDLEKKELDKEDQDINSRLDVYGCKNTDELNRKIGELKETINQLTESRNIAKAEKERTAKTYEKAIKDNELFKTLEEYNKKLKELDDLGPKVDEKKKKLVLAENADEIRENYSAYQKADSDKKKADKDYRDAETELNEAKTQNEEVLKEKELHDKGKEQIDSNKERLTRLKDAKTLYDELVQKKDKFDNSKRDLGKKEKKG